MARGPIAVQSATPVPLTVRQVRDPALQGGNIAFAGGHVNPLRAIPIVAVDGDADVTLPAAGRGGAAAGAYRQCAIAFLLPAMTAVAGVAAEHRRGIGGEEVRTEAEMGTPASEVSSVGGLSVAPTNRAMGQIDNVHLPTRALAQPWSSRALLRVLTH